MTKVLFCIGNPQKGDDIVALKLGQKVEENLKEWIVIYGEEIPENHIHKLREINADLIVVADACVGLMPNSQKANFLELDPDDISYSFSTHNIPLPILIKYIKEFCPKTLFLGINVESKNLIYKENHLSSNGILAMEKAYEKIKEFDEILEENRT